MTEEQYFVHLEMRVSDELQGMRDPKLRRLWCDGFLPEKFVITASGSHISGRVWLDQEPWNFVVLLGRATLPRDQVNWAALIPAEDVTGWLYLDFQNEFMKVKALGGYRDDDPAGR